MRLIRSVRSFKSHIRHIRTADMSHFDEEHPECVSGPGTADRTDETFVWLDGNSKIVFSAPHNAEQFREGSMKQAEPETGPIVIEMNRKFNCPGIYRIINDMKDPNHDPVSEYREFLKMKITEHGYEILFDLHQMSPSRDIDICIGTGHGKNIFGRRDIVDTVKDSFVKNGITNITIDDPFSAAFKHTVSSSVARGCAVPSVQIEINSWLFEKYADVQRVHASFSEIVSELEGIK
jgi:hypothetical protein